LNTTSNVSVTVSQTLTSVSVSPASATVGAGSTKQFSAVAKDQFGAAMLVAPSFTWSVASGGGTVTQTGLYTAPGVAGTATATASTGGISGSARVTTVVKPAAPSRLGAVAVSWSQVN